MILVRAAIAALALFIALSIARREKRRRHCRKWYCFNQREPGYMPRNARERALSNQLDGLCSFHGYALIRRALEQREREALSHREARLAGLSGEIKIKVDCQDCGGECVGDDRITTFKGVFHPECYKEAASRPGFYD